MEVSISTQSDSVNLHVGHSLCPLVCNLRRHAVPFIRVCYCFIYAKRIVTANLARFVTWF